VIGSPLHVDLDGDTADEESKTVLSLFARAFRTHPDPISQAEYEATVAELLNVIPRRDTRYLLSGRPRRHTLRSAGHGNPDRDPWLSHLCFYGFLAQPTGNRDSGRLFADLAMVARLRYLLAPHSGLGERVLTLVLLGNAHHPDVQLDAQALQRVR
jgi:hypothetical protein